MRESNEPGPEILDAGDGGGAPLPLLRTAETYRTLLDAAPDAMIVLKESGSIVVSNVQAERQFRYKRNELLEKPVAIIMPSLSELIDADNGGAGKEALASLVGTVIPMTGRRKDGSDFPLDLSLSLSTSRDGLLVTAAIRGGGERRAIESTSSTASDPAQAADAAIGAGRSDYHQGSTAHLAKLGEMHREELAAQQRAHVQDITERLDLEDQARVVIEKFATGVRQRTAAAADAKLADVTAAAAQSESSFRLLVNGVKDYGIFMLDPLGNVSSWNTGAERIKGYSAQEIIGRPFSLFYPEGDVLAGQPAAHLAMAVQTGRCEDEGWRVRKDGTTFWASAVLTPIHSAAGTLLGFAKITHDPTERRHLQDRLNQSQKLEAVGSLAAGVAHDFNNLLSVILTYSQILDEDLAANDPLREYAEDIRAAGLRAVDLTKQLLAFSRQQVLQSKVVDLSRIVAGMEKMLRRLIGEDIELTATYHQGTGKVLVDPGQMEQVIMNLAINARDAMPQGGQLTVEVTEVMLDDDFVVDHVGAKAGRHVMMAVSDTGVGMTEAIQARLFEPFFTTKELGKGTGLGLATVFGIVKQSGGTIWVYSEVGKGTVFKVYLPLADRDAPGRVDPVPVDGRSLLGTETILLVDDDHRVRASTRIILKRYGYNVLEAQGGGDALLLCEQHPEDIHLLLTDVVMPRMSGRQLAERLRVVRPRMKVLYMSGYTDDAVVRHGILSATIAFIQKPITPAALGHKVRETLDIAVAPAEPG